MNRLALLTLLIASLTPLHAGQASTPLYSATGDSLKSDSADMIAPDSSESQDGEKSNDGTEKKQVKENFQPALPPQDDQIIHENGNVTIRLGPANTTTFLKPTLDNLVRAYTKLTGVDMEDNKVIDDFAAIAYCGLYSQYFPNEFVWRQARAAIRQTIQRDLEKYPEYFLINGMLQIGRYDFEKHTFSLTEKSKMDHTGRFIIDLKKPKDCDNAPITLMPLAFNVRLTNPVTLDQIPVAESLAHDITEAIAPDANSQRRVYVTFYIRANDFSTRNKSNSDTPRATMRATLLSMRVYIDPQHSQLIYDYRPH